VAPCFLRASSGHPPGTHPACPASLLKPGVNQCDLPQMVCHIETSGIKRKIQGPRASLSTKPDCPGHTVCCRLHSPLPPSSWPAAKPEGFCAGRLPWSWRYAVSPWPSNAVDMDGFGREGAGFGACLPGTYTCFCTEAFVGFDGSSLFSTHLFRTALFFSHRETVCGSVPLDCPSPTLFRNFLFTLFPLSPLPGAMSIERP